MSGALIKMKGGMVLCDIDFVGVVIVLAARVWHGLRGMS